MQVALLGNTGFLGKNVADALSAAGIAFAGASRSSGVDLRSVEQTTNFLRVTRPDVILHCAAHVGMLARHEPLPRQPQVPGGAYYKFEEPNGLQVDLSWSQEQMERFIRATTFAPVSEPWLQIGDRRFNLVEQPAASPAV